MEKSIIDRIWNEELDRFELKNENIYWRHGYQKDFARSYVQNFKDQNQIRVTIDDTLKSEKKVRGDIRHELNHSYCYEHNLQQSELDCIFAEFFPDIQLWYYRRILKKKRK